MARLGVGYGPRADGLAAGTAFLARGIELSSAAPPLQEGFPPGLGGGAARWARLAALLAPVLITLLLYGRSLDEFFQKEDFELIRRARDGGLVELVTTRAINHVHGENYGPFWRPGWWVAVELLHRCFDLEPFGYRLWALALHVLLLVSVQLAVLRWTGSHLAGFLAGLFLATTPAPIEAVVWMSAATNVMPAVLAVGASGVAWLVYLHSGKKRAAAAALILFALSLAFREAGYHLPPLFLLGWLVMRGVPRTARDWLRCGIPVLLAGAVVQLHFLVLDPNVTPSISPLQWVQRIGGNAAKCAGLFLPFSQRWVALGISAVVLVALFVISGARARYFLLWSALAVFPYVASKGYAPRFSYFPALPLAVGLALAANDAGRRAGRAGTAVATAALCGLGLTNALFFPQVLDPYQRFSRSCKRVLDDGLSQGVAGFERVCIDNVPPVLRAGVESMFELYLGKRIDFTDAHMYARPPFVIHEGDIPAEAPEQGFMRIDRKQASVQFCDRATFLRGLAPISMFSFPREPRLVASAGEALAMIRRGEVDLTREILLGEQWTIAPGSEEVEVLSKRWAPGRFELELRTPADAFVVLAWRSRGAARVTVDGRPAPILQADGLFQAIELPAGSRRVVWQGRLDLKKWKRPP